jgi:hypothetical protein
MTWRRVAAWAVLLGVVAAMAGGFALLGGDAGCATDANAAGSDPVRGALAADGCPTDVEWTLATLGVVVAAAGVVLGLVVVE